MNTENLEYIKNVLGKENEISDDYAAISDLQLGQRSLLKWEYKNRYINQGLTRFSFDDIYNNNLTHKVAFERKNIAMLESDSALVPKYLKYLEDNKDKKYLLDLGDFIFELSKTREEYFLNNFGKEFAKTKKELSNAKTILLLGNHDKEERKEFYHQVFFDEVKYYVFYIKNNTIYIFTHEPITARFIEMDKFKAIKSLVRIIKGTEFDIINIHGHTHSNNINSEVDGELLEEISQYKNECIEPKLLAK